MKWFRHYTDAHTNEGLRKLRAAMGMEGIGIWWTVLEIIASKMDETDRCHATFPVADWCSFLGVKQKKLSLFLVLTEFELNLKSVYSGNELSLECRKLLEFRDEWTKRLRSNTVVTPVSTPSQSQSQSQSQSKTTNLPPTGTPLPPKAEAEPERSVGSVFSEFVTLGKDIPIPSPDEYNRQKNEALMELLRERQAERAKENQHFEAKKREAAAHYADEFAALIPNADDTIRAELHAKISRLQTLEHLQTTLEDVKSAIESGNSTNPKGLIFYRLKQV